MRRPRSRARLDSGGLDGARLEPPAGVPPQPGAGATRLRFSIAPPRTAPPASVPACWEGVPGRLWAARRLSPARGAASAPQSSSSGPAEFRDSSVPRRFRARSWRAALLAGSAALRVRAADRARAGAPPAGRVLAPPTQAGAGHGRSTWVRVAGRDRKGPGPERAQEWNGAVPGKPAAQELDRSGQGWRQSSHKPWDSVWGTGGDPDGAGSCSPAGPGLEEEKRRHEATEPDSPSAGNRNITASTVRARMWREPS